MPFNINLLTWSATSLFCLGELDREDIELLFHFFWLPHSHGPKAQISLNYFKQLLEDAHIIQKLGLYNKRDGEMVDETSGSITPEVSPSRTSSGDLSMNDGASAGNNSNVDMEDLHESTVALQEPRPERNFRSTWLRKARYLLNASWHAPRIASCLE